MTERADNLERLYAQREQVNRLRQMLKDAEYFRTATLVWHCDRIVSVFDRQSGGGSRSALRFDGMRNAWNMDADMWVSLGFGAHFVPECVQYFVYAFPNTFLTLNEGFKKAALETVEDWYKQLDATIRTDSEFLAKEKALQECCTEQYRSRSARACPACHSTKLLVDIGARLRHCQPFEVVAECVDCGFRWRESYNLVSLVDPRLKDGTATTWTATVEAR